MDKYKVIPGTLIDIDSIPADDKSFFEGTKEEGREYLHELNLKLKDLQSRFFAKSDKKLLVILQGMDTSGKDGTIRCVFHAVNPQGVKVEHFDVPNQAELAHDYLWRVHHKVPAKGEISIFNRSHYEDCVTVRVHELTPPEVWAKRFDHINSFEKMLYDEGTVIIKIFLHIDSDEQKRRIQRRIDRPEKRWKFHPKDLEARQYWGDYSNAYNAAISKTATHYAPWYIVPANAKWYRNIVVSQLIIDELEKLDLSMPVPDYDFENLKVV
jgi:PPK2 family polyphosphate:nucleotide phosphotransferase